MKKISIIVLIISIILFSLGVFFAYDKHFKYILPKEYKKEIELLLEQETPKATQEIDGLYKEIENEKDPYDKEILIETGINTILFNLYNKLIFVTQKYKNLDSEIPLTDFDVDLAITIFPYLKKNQVDYTILKQFLKYTDKKQLEFKQIKTSH
ncbi:MAG: hypothetical protein IKU37_00260 [Candidatus Gastranaerophilales bacterium]|nr:hypothetical protein [Candidatus Gastranaerophilales bacterium]